MIREDKGRLVIIENAVLSGLIVTSNISNPIASSLTRNHLFIL